MSDQETPTGEKHFETKQGLLSVPATQKPMPLQDYFANERLPEALKRYNVFITEAGPVIEARPKVSWSTEHDKRLDDIVDQAKSSIDEHGYYLRGTLNRTRNLARETDRSADQVFYSFQGRFVEKFGETPKAMVQTWRRARNLPVQSHESAQHRGPEIER